MIKTILNNISIEEFETLFKKYYKQLCLYAFKYVKNNIIAEEIVQDVFFKIWEKRSFIKIKISAKSYLYMSVRNRCLQYLKHKKIEKSYEKYIDNQAVINTEMPYENIIYDETLDIFNEVLNTLPAHCSQIFILSRFNGLKYREIADRLSISVKTVEANISKALKLLRVYFPEY
ncbi:MAG: RNA polymerase sigma-70 factor [Chlorobi bacterium]|nr:RNA polymerase sigma-70 factor [Chlorobiota bacterium]